MTIQAAFNKITEDLGGTPSTDGTIAGAIDALNDTLAGSDQERGNSIEDAVRLLGEHIGGGGGGTYSIACYEQGEEQAEPISSFVYKAKVQTVEGVQYFVPDGESVESAAAGDCLITTVKGGISAVLSELAQTALVYPTGYAPLPEGGASSIFVMPANDVVVMRGGK